MSIYARVTKLNNIVGRANYIMDSDRHKNILCSSPLLDFTPYQKHEQANNYSKRVKKIEGRELVFALNHDFLKYSEEKLKEEAQKYAELIAGKKTDMVWAVHLNKKGEVNKKPSKAELKYADPDGKVRYKHDNLHLHVVFSERHYKPDKSTEKRYTRDIYHTERGTIARNKSERAKNPDGTDKPPVHRKGDVIDNGGFFTAKDPKYREKDWLHKTKLALVEQLIKDGIRPYPKNRFKYYKQGKGSDSREIKLKNTMIKHLNLQVRKMYTDRVDEDTITKHIRTSKNILKSRRYPAMYKGSDGRWTVAIAATAMAALNTMLGIGVDIVAEIAEKALESSVSVSKPSQPPEPQKSPVSHSEPPRGDIALMERLANEKKERQRQATMERLVKQNKEKNTASQNTPNIETHTLFYEDSRLGKKIQLHVEVKKNGEYVDLLVAPAHERYSGIQKDTPREIFNYLINTRKIPISSKLGRTEYHQKPIEQVMADKQKKRSDIEL